MTTRPAPWRSFVGALVFVARAALSETLSVVDLDKAPGATGVVIPITLTSSVNLTVLRFDVVFDPALCAQLANSQAISIRKTGRTTVDPEENTITCGAGQITIAVVDLSGNTVVPSGSGSVFEIVLGSLTPTASGRFALTPQAIVGNNGATPVNVTPDAGDLRIGCTSAADCDDGNSCTTDQCSPTGPVCTHTSSCGCG